MSIFDWFKKKTSASKSQASQNQKSREELYKSMLEQMAQQSPSRHFVAGAVFDLVRRLHDSFEEIVRSNDASSLKAFWAKTFLFFCENPSVVGMPPSIVNTNNNDTDPRQWNADIFNLSNGDVAALCFMPVQSDMLSARIICIILGQNGDGYYYCMLDKDENKSSDVMRNKAQAGVEKVGEVKGLGFELMNSFLNCCQTNYYSN